MENKRNLPTLQDLYNDKDLVEKQSQLAVLLNQKPNDKWLKIHPLGNFKYLPIERVEWLLTRIFTKWSFEIKSVQVIANAVVTIGTLTVYDISSGDYIKQDGVGAAPIQTDKGAAATDFAKVKTDAVQKAAPASKSYAIKDAAECFGKLFGKDLNRSDQLSYDSMIKTEEVEQELPKSVTDAINNVVNLEDLNQLYRDFSEHHDNDTFLNLCTKKKEELS